MKAFILKVIKVSDCEYAPPWRPWYDKCFKMVVVAESEEQARQLASEKCCREGKDAWLCETYSSCEELNMDEAGVIVRDVSEA